MPKRNMFYLYLNFIFYMKNFSKVMLSIIFTALIVGSVQPVLADDITDIFKLVPIKNSEY